MTSSSSKKRPKRRRSGGPDWRAMATASGFTARHVRDLVDRGAPMPRVGELLEQWAMRLQQWCEKNRRKPGPKVSPEAERILSRLEQLQVKRLEMRNMDLAMEIAKKRKQLVLRTDHEAVLTALIDAVRDLIVGQGERLRLRLAHREAEDAQRELEADSASILEELAAGEWRRPEWLRDSKPGNVLDGIEQVDRAATGAGAAAAPQIEKQPEGAA